MIFKCVDRENFGDERKMVLGEIPAIGAVELQGEGREGARRFRDHQKNMD